MSTAGLDFFDKDFFHEQVVILCDYPLEKMKWYSGINDDIISEWKKDNIDVDQSTEILAKQMLDNWGAEILSIPLCGENKIKHYFEKVLWLIQSYCEYGWRNPLKGINHLDNGYIVIHPGTNRCVAAKFLRCEKLSVLINVNKKQNLMNIFKDEKNIVDEETLRDTLVSADKILWRTESQEELWINGVNQIGVYYKDFTYEFLGADAWPNSEKINHWSYNFYNSLPLKIYVHPDLDYSFIDQQSRHMKNLTFVNRVDGMKKKFEYNFLLSTKIQDDNFWIYLDKNCNFKRNIFELLFFVSSSHRIIRSADDTIVINNPFSTDNKELIIPDHYLK
jgi:hypothetical protein